MHGTQVHVDRPAVRAAMRRVLLAGCSDAVSSMRVEGQGMGKRGGEERGKKEEGRKGDTGETNDEAQYTLLTVHSTHGF